MSRRVSLKSLSEQVVVVTGASSGIGLATARMAARRGAAVVLSSRNEEALKKAAERIRRDGGRALAVAADVAEPEDMARLAKETASEFGRIDSWINNAGLSIYGKLDQTPMEEKRRLFDVNFWGVVNGCRAALPYLRKTGGALVNVGSVLSERAIPMQGIYVASKHAVKGYTDSLRMELEAEGAPVSVTLVKPGAIDTPYPEHAVNRMDSHPVHTPPVYEPDVVARAILNALERPQRDVYVGGSAKAFAFFESIAPRLLDFAMERWMVDGQKDERLDGVPQRPALRSHPRREGRERGRYPGRVLARSFYTELSQSRWPGFLAAAGVAIGVGVLTRALLHRQGGQSSLAEGGLSRARRAVQNASGFATSILQ